MYALSTAWNVWRAKSGEAIAAEAADLGFSNIELSFSFPVRLFLEIKELKKAGRINVVSLHNFCPLPVYANRGDTTPDMFLLSSPDEGERARAVRFTKQTIDSAKDIGASCAVLHLGRVDIGCDGSKTLMRMLDAGKSGYGYYRFLKGRFLLRRERNKKRYLQAVLKSLDELCDYASERGVKLGIETRYYIREIPSFEEVGVILDKFKGRNVRYWHDVGHAQVKENLGIDSHDAYLRSYADRMIGIHIHDVVNSDDHRAPLTGAYDFKKLKPYLKKETVKVFEMHHPAKAEEIKKALQFFRNEICQD